MAEYIKKEDVLRAYEEVQRRNGPWRFETLIESVPTADVAPVRHGRWLCVDTDTEQFFLCNRCKKKEYWESNYCPNCGAKMEGGDNNG